MKTKIEDIFLAYANHSFRDNIENLRKVFDEIFYQSPIIQISKPDILIEYMVNKLIEYAKCDDPYTAKKIKNERPPTRTPMPDLNRALFEAIHAYRGGFCEGKSWRGRCRVNLGYPLARLRECGIVGAEQLKCIECGQLRFVDMLLDIVEGKEYEDIKNSHDAIPGVQVEAIKTGDSVGPRCGTFESILAGAYICANDYVIIRNNKLEKRTKIYLTNLLWGSSQGVTTRVLFWLEGAVAYSLVEFLLNNDRRKLKQCSRCGKFFVAAKAYTSKSGKYFCRDCSPRDNRTREQKNQAQRAYRKRKKEKKKRQSYEKRIEYLIEKGIDRKQAEEIAKADIYGENLK